MLLYFPYIFGQANLSSVDTTLSEKAASGQDTGTHTAAQSTAVFRHIYQLQNGLVKILEQEHEGVTVSEYLGEIQYIIH